MTYDRGGTTSVGGGDEAQGGGLPILGQGGQTNGGGEAFGGSVGLDDAGPPDARLSDPGTVDAAVPANPCDDDALERCDGIDNDCDGAIDEQLACPVPCVGLAIEGHGYMLCTASVDRSTALATCAAQQMKLAWLETPAENAALVASIDPFIVPGASAVFMQIGASDSAEEGVWRWVGAGTAADGFQFWAGTRNAPNSGPVGDSYESWADVEPNNFDDEDCGVLTIRANNTNRPGQWDDTGCELPYPFVCEQP